MVRVRHRAVTVRGTCPVCHSKSNTRWTTTVQLKNFGVYVLFVMVSISSSRRVVSVVRLFQKRDRLAQIANDGSGEVVYRGQWWMNGAYFAVEWFPGVLGEG